MERTKKRPIPVGKIEAENARLWYYVIYYLCFNAWSFTELFSGMFARLFYLFLYIYIHNLVEKKNTSNIVIGGRWCFSSSYWLGLFNGRLNTLILFCLPYLDTTTFLGIALYKILILQSKVPILSSLRTKAKIQIFLYSLLLMIVSLLPYFLSYSGFFYNFPCSKFVFLYLAYKILKSDDKKTPFAPSLFKFSIIYLYLTFSSL